MTSRIAQLASHLDPRSKTGVAAATAKHADDVVIIAAGRTPLCKAFKGGLKDTNFDLMLLEHFKSILDAAELDPKIIEDVVVGNVHNERAAYDVRAAALAAGIPNTTPTIVVNRWCSSGLMAIRAVANAIQAGEIQCGLATGAESMTFAAKENIQRSSEVDSVSQDAKDCSMPMGWTSENVAKDFNISRQRMDAFAARSHQRAGAAQAAGKFDVEILPISAVALPAGKEGPRERKLLKADEGIRHGSTPEALGKIKAAFPQWAPSHTTGGNASQITDGAASVVLMKRSLANKLGKKILGKYVACSVAGLPPRIMGIGPVFAIPKVLEVTGVSQDQVDLFEINEAFSSMAVYCQEKLGLSDDKLNVNGGACALGHPLGATGARLVITILAELERRKQNVGVVSMCIGTGQGAAAVIVRE